MTLFSFFFIDILLAKKNICFYEKLCERSYFMKKDILTMTEEEKQELSKICGDSVVMMAQCYSDRQIADKVGLNCMQVRDNAAEMLYVLRNYVGRWKFFKILFWK